MVAYFESRFDNPLHRSHFRFRRDVIGITPEEEEAWRRLCQEGEEDKDGEEVLLRHKVA